MLNFFAFVCSYLVQNIFKHRVKPRVLQLPVTGRCNSRCITCNIWQNRGTQGDIDPIELKKALADPFFSKVHSVGLNGGEPSLYPHTKELIDSLTVLKNLRRIYVISNGIVSARLLNMMKILKESCAPRYITVYLAVSIDGVGRVHDAIRGIPGAFEKTMQCLKELQAQRELYCDVLEAGCTLSIQNMPYMAELDVCLKEHGIHAYYHPAVPNKRLHNFEAKGFSILNDERSRMLAEEYFFVLFKYGKSLKTRLRAFLTFDYFLYRGSRRLAGCNYLRSDVTINENLDICLCAAASNIAGNLKSTSASMLLKEGAFKRAEKETARHCKNCVHYIIFPTLAGAYQFIRELLKPSIWIIYKVLAAWSR
jgi:MoaA/NifB/PqqE/SkfB family radical SAM enzyme